MHISAALAVEIGKVEIRSTITERCAIPNDTRIGPCKGTTRGCSLTFVIEYGHITSELVGPTEVR